MFDAIMTSRYCRKCLVSYLLWLQVKTIFSEDLSSFLWSCWDWITKGFKTQRSPSIVGLVWMYSWRCLIVNVLDYSQKSVSLSFFFPTQILGIFSSRTCSWCRQIKLFPPHCLPSQDLWSAIKSSRHFKR